MSASVTGNPPRLALVTGGAGFIGSHLADALVTQGLRVRVLDNFVAGPRENVNPAAETVVGDVRVLDSIRPAFEGVDCVFHMAALPRVMLSIERPVETHVVNVVGTLNALIAARDAGVRRFIYSGSSSVYGEQATRPLRETMTPNPLNPYALQKLAGEQYTRMFHRLFGMGTLTLRYFNIYGPRMATEGAYVTVIGVFIREKVAGRPLIIHGDGSQRRDFTHVRDAVRANLAAMDAAVGDGRALNVGRGENLSVNQIAEIVGGPVEHVGRRPGDARDTLADLSATRAALRWEPEIATADGVRELMRLAGCS
jgi:UDP-glucose 4-epimerase